MAKYWIALIGAVIISSISQMFLKNGAGKSYKNVIREYLNVWVIVGYLLMFVSTFCVIFAYTKIAYKNGPIIESLGYVLIMILSRIIFKEKITKNKVIGNAIILLGIAIFYI